MRLDFGLGRVSYHLYHVLKIIPRSTGAQEPNKAPNNVLNVGRVSAEKSPGETWLIDNDLRYNTR
jgi:hypothetical protein